MELDMDSLKKFKRTVEKCILELAKKDDLTPPETKAALDGMMLREKLCEAIEDCEMEEYSERGRSRRQGSFNTYGYSGMSYYAEPNRYRSNYPMTQGYNSMNNMGGTYGMPYDPYYSEDGFSERGRRGYSRHSIGDRAIEKLENLMDKAGSEYEKEELHKFIRMIRAAADEG